MHSPKSDPHIQAQGAFDVLSKHMLLGRLDVLFEATQEIAYSTVSEKYKGAPTPGSPMAADIVGFSAEAVGNVGRVCGVWHVVAAEALQAVASAHADGRILFAPGSLLRAAIEHSARIGWVLDGPTGRTRAARAWLAHVVANGEDTHTHRNAGNPTSTLAGAPARLEELCEQILPDLFNGEQPDRTNRRPSEWTLLNQKWGTNTDCVDDFFANHVHQRWRSPTDGRVQYRVASMFAHPSTTAIFAQADQSEPGTATFSWDWPLTRTRSIVALASFQSATQSLYDYLGWSPPSLAAWSEHLSQFVTETASADDQAAGERTLEPEVPAEKTVGPEEAMGDESI